MHVIGGAVLYRATWGDKDAAHDANCDDTTACYVWGGKSNVPPWGLSGPYRVSGF